MFLEEARVAARLQHANVVEVLDCGQQGDVVYLVMPLIEGDSLASLVRRMSGRRIALPNTLRIVVDVLRGLHVAHELKGQDGRPMQLVHRDVSPQNILVGTDGVAKVTDFGIAKARGGLAEETETGQIKGKVSYLSPEQALGQPLDRRSDIFAAGIVLWECLTGERAFPSADPATLRQLESRRVSDPREVEPTISPALSAVVLKAAAPLPEDRFATADQMADALEAAAQSPPATTKELGSWVRDLIGADLDRRHRELRLATVVDASFAPGPDETAVSAPPSSTRGLRLRWVVAATVALLMAISGMLVIRTRSEKRGEAASATELPTAAVTSAGGAPSLAPPVDSTAIDSTSAGPATPPHRTIVRATATPRARPPAPRPKFDNPYGSP
jgi:serine/threonine-protein kinase